MHDLLREYAATLAADIPPGERVEALHAILDLQLHAAADSNLPVYRKAALRDIGVRDPLRPDLVAAVADPVARLERERPYLVAYVDAAAAVPELRAYAWQLPRAAWRQLFMRGYLDDIYLLNQRALAVLERTGDRAATATVLNYLASVHYRHGRFDEAIRILERCIALRRELPDRDSLARAMSNLAGLLYETGRWKRSIAVAQEVRRFGGAQYGRDEMNVMAHSYHRLGRYREALRCHRLRLMAQLDIRDPTRLGDTLLNIAVIKYHLGLVSLETAIRQARTALRPILRVDYRYGQGYALHELAQLLAADGQFREAIAAHLRAIEIAQDLANLDQERKLTHGFAKTLALVGDETAARAMFERSLRLAEKTQLPYAIALSQGSLGACLITDDPEEARRLLELARTGLAAVDAPELRDAENALAALGGVDHLRAGAVGETMVR
ncbi:tetratricopeptide repeat protein [Actinoplanes solisilvae]|uniref:tetratricopeptide repeat protein n=1 Tax=Actinoplanes solisilvae TaxID=2486853 RepID=UPI0013E2B04E|nr:tetratricopeptide repeat protein [Actinoplanes solisilvae]